ncbi:MAG: hypothetical protein V4574_06530 [Pseudomonadota bacterium]
MPPWLKLTYLFAAIPAWLFIIFCVLTGQHKSFKAIAALGIFAGVTLLHIVFDRRKGGAGHEAGGGIDIGGDS